MGGCFGGFGSPFSMGGSLFSMMGMGMGGYGCGFGGFGMGCYSDQMVGAQIGNMISGVLIGGISKAIEGRGAAIAERQEKLDTAKNNVKSLNKEIDEIESQQKDLVIPAKGEKTSSALIKLCPTEANAYNSSLATYNDIDKRTEDYYKNDPEIKSLLEATPKDQGKINKKVADKINADKIAYFNGELEAKLNALQTAVNEKKRANDEKLNTLRSDLKEAQKIIDDVKEAERVKFNNKNAKLEAKCDAEGEVDSNKKVDEHKTAQSKFNKAYENFKSNQTQENFNVLKEKYNEIEGNKTSFTKLMKHIVKQHPEFDSTNINWG